MYVKTSKAESRFVPKKKPKNFKKTFKRLFKYFKEEKRILNFVFITVIIDSLIVILVPYLIGKCIDIIDFRNINYNILSILIITLLIFYIIDSIVNLTKEFVVVSMSQRIVKRIRSSLFKKIQLLPIEYFDTHHNGDLMSRITNDVENISGGISGSIVQIITSIITIVGTFIMMLILSPILTLISIVIIPLVLVLSNSIANKTKLFFKKQQVELGCLNSHIEESITNINIIKSFNYEDQSIKKFNTINNNLLEVSLKAQLYSSLLMPMMNVISNIGFALISFIGAILSVKGMITVGVIVTFLTYMKQFTRPLNEIANLFNTLQSAVAGCERVFEVLDEKIEEDFYSKENSLKNLDCIKGNIRFENVWFGYEKDKFILKDINFIIKEGTSNAIIGSTGSGKTTIINLITRFYQPDKGNILIDNENINTFYKKSFRKLFGVVPQDIYLFSGTIIDNIRYSKSEATYEEVVDACKLSNAHNFISNLKDGYYTEISESGQSLSIGEKQLLSIARAILNNPSLLILDEATSSIDTSTEKKIQDAIKVMMKGRTSIIIAHRLSTIMDCDNIMVMDKGHIVESGSHDELMELKGIYYKNICILKGESI